VVSFRRIKREEVGRQSSSWIRTLGQLKIVGAFNYFRVTIIPTAASRLGQVLGRAVNGSVGRGSNGSPIVHWSHMGHYVFVTLLII